MNRKKLNKAFVTTLMSLLLICISLAVLSCSKNSDKLQNVRIAQAGNFFLYAPLYIAIDAGLFKEQGLDVSIISTGGDEKTWAAVVSGGASFGVADPTFIAISENRGKPGKVVASIVNGVPFWGITFDDSIKPIKAPEGLEGYTVGTFPSPSTAYTLQKKMFLDAGLKPDIREGAFGTILAMLKSKHVNIGLELEPNVSMAVSEGAKIVYSLAYVYGNFAITGLTTTPKLIRQNPELVQKVVCGLQAALDFSRNNMDLALLILAERFPEIKRGIAREALKRVFREGIIPQTTIIDSLAWNKAINLRKEVGDITEVQDMSAYVDNSFAKEASIKCRDR
ncbi:MAG: ABC transporter substrate-binding protein [Candidatus Scalindua rubra]|uniref:Thiamine pyrimidine synthase n=1 Tax=Candidatus Scalindua brodae TaxID=237368 RepID=A0A0B0EM11_9BACT|nr:MAG: NMT1/THI5 like protein [Candidatus Scalindua brodae]MBZ0110370.1 ABC transporter substrate-binding protein [Candidatus Scalindua rubra]TWU33955.1 NMT1/THI5 like protein [Candidatus Brocadiaceae bacterium S225]